VKIEPGRNNKIIIRIPYNQDVSVHFLRHSFATYFLESEVNLRYIQEFPGHKSLKTTEIYTYISTKNLSAIKTSLITFKRRWNIRIKTKNNGRSEGSIYKQFAYISHLGVYENYLNMNELGVI